MKDFKIIMPEECKECSHRGLVVHQVEITKLGDRGKMFLDTLHCINEELCEYLKWKYKKDEVN